MPEYRIVTKIDPAGAVQGAAKVKQELAGIEQAAGSAGAATERMTAAQFRAAQKAGGEFKNLGKAISDAARAQQQAEQAAHRVENAVDQEAAAVRRINALLRDAKTAYAAGAISLENYNRVQKLAADGHAQIQQSLGRTRAGFTQLSFQLGDISQQMALGVRGSTIFAQQSGQVIQALQVMGGGTNAFLKFLGGPWGIALSTAAVVLLPLIARMFDFNDAVGQSVEKLKEDAKASEIDRQAQERFQHSKEGVEKAIRDATAARIEAIKQQRTEAEQTNIAAQNNYREELSIRRKTQAQIAYARELLQAQIERASGPSQASEVAALGLVGLQGRLNSLQTEAAKQDKLIAAAERELQASRGDLAVEQANARAESQITPQGRITAEYDAQKKSLEAQYKLKIAAAGSTANENALTREQIRLANELTARLTALGKERDRQLQTIRQTNDGVAKFRSREQAIGIAGRELQGAGLKVGENVQFGGVHADHPGMGNAAHGRFAIDVNQGTGITEANVPDIKNRFDQLARLYQSRGYRVLWRGYVWEAGGNGPTRPIPGGQAQHYDHMHLEAPGTIVGKPTQASTAEQALREGRQEQTAAEQRGDFVQGIVDKAAGRGMPKNRATDLTTEIDAQLAEYQRRFNQAPTPAEHDKIVGALTSASAREQAEHFREAYLYPLDDLEKALGKTGLEREIYNKVLAETAAKGAPLDPIEKAMIENSVRHTDVLKREQEVLASINDPIENYKQQITALTDLLNKGAISQAAFNARVSDLQGPARALLADMPADQMDPNSGLSYGQISATAEENARYAAQQAAFETNRQILLDMGINYDALEAAAHIAHINKLNAIDQQRRSTQLMAASNLFDSLAQIAEAGMGKQSAIYKAMFAVSKAFAIADAIIKIQQAMAQALALPFPANLPALASVAALGASIIANISAVAANFDKGGYTGDLARDQAAGIVHGQEFVVNAAATARNRPLLEAINNGGIVDRQRRAGNDNQRSLQTASGDQITYSFGDVVVQAGNATAKDGEIIGRDVKRAIEGLIQETMAKETRPGGRLTRTRSSMMAGPS